jgi:hypothetical protein
VDTYEGPQHHSAAQLQSTAFMTDLQEYMYESRGVMVGAGGIQHKGDYPGLAFTSTGAVALYGDDALEKKLGLSASYRAVQAQNGVVHQVFDPTVEEPKWHGTHESSGHVDAVTVV